MKTKMHILNAIPEIVGWFSIVAGMTILGSILGVPLAFQASLTPGLVIGGIVCLVVIFFGIRVVIMSSKAPGGIELVSRKIVSPDLGANRNSIPQVVSSAEVA
jgi:hypothetical protein